MMIESLCDEVTMTSLHLLKNIGFQLAKPDRHLVRISKAAGYENPDVMCKEIATITYEKIEVIDLVFWRHATLRRDYLYQLQSMISSFVLPE